MIRSVLILGMVLGVGSGCVPIPKGFDSPEPAARIAAAVEATASGDIEAVPDLIALLDSDDPATRLVSITALRRLTGQTLGYDHAAPFAEREAAVGRWVEWYDQNADALNAQAGAPRRSPSGDDEPDHG
ncbi:MAG: hypothetical protein Q9O74_01850 [Planctomycetota bacterium]|nr:hypothetical protein [Planctomycetota bacterium]